DWSILKGRSILIVDENIKDGTAVKSFLKSAGVTSTTVSNGVQAILELIKPANHWDGIFIAQDLTDIKSEDLKIALGAISTTQEIPLFLMTSQIFFDPENKNGEHRFSAYINKPIGKNKLLSTLTNILAAKEYDLLIQDPENLEIPYPKLQNNGDRNRLIEEAHNACSLNTITSEPDEDQAYVRKRQQVLIVDDSPMNTKLLETALSDDFDTFVAHSGKDALMIANSINPPDLILLDIMMPEMNGYEVCKTLHLEQKTKDIPVIFLTALSESDNEEYGLKLGAIDYITKPFSIPIVKAKIKNHLALKYYQDILKINTDIDQLTKIPNRRRFDEMFDIETRKAKRTGSFLSVLMLDIDHFKFYNDTYGHLEGDECLRQVAYAIKTTLKRPGDMAARWGGEEFTCLLPDTDAEGAAEVAEKIRKTIMELGIAHKASPVASVVTVSIGVVTLNQGDQDGYELLLKHADETLYQAKAQGRNRINQWVD
ncbi:diguanylate cyclase domain-containing protein, partial [Acetobacterium sp.]|uniref:diguanylate cyclase domain-containing protein n=1 Tax=Acetobacterium sp. TaxID=1872094 RepID=UPI0027263CEF